MLTIILKLLYSLYDYFVVSDMLQIGFLLLYIVNSIIERLPDGLSHMKLSIRQETIMVLNKNKINVPFGK